MGYYRRIECGRRPRRSDEPRRRASRAVVERETRDARVEHGRRPRRTTSLRVVLWANEPKPLISGIGMKCNNQQTYIRNGSYGWLGFVLTESTVVEHGRRARSSSTVVEHGRRPSSSAVGTSNGEYRPVHHRPRQRAMDEPFAAAWSSEKPLSSLDFVLPKVL